MRNEPINMSCEDWIKNSIIDKFLYTGVENTSYWRPRVHSGKLSPQDIRKRLFQFVNVSACMPCHENCACSFHFRFNINSSIIVLEHEGILMPFGY